MCMARELQGPGGTFSGEEPCKAQELLSATSTRPLLISKTARPTRHSCSMMALPFVLLSLMRRCSPPTEGCGSVVSQGMRQSWGLKKNPANALRRYAHWLCASLQKTIRSTRNPNHPLAVSQLPYLPILLLCPGWPCPFIDLEIHQA